MYTKYYDGMMLYLMEKYTGTDKAQDIMMYHDQGIRYFNADGYVHDCFEIFKRNIDNTERKTGLRKSHLTNLLEKAYQEVRNDFPSKLRIY